MSFEKQIYKSLAEKLYNREPLRLKEGKKTEAQKVLIEAYQATLKFINTLDRASIDSNSFKKIVSDKKKAAYKFRQVTGNTWPF